jgi:hypothetical protein
MSEIPALRDALVGAAARRARRRRRVTLTVAAWAAVAAAIAFVLVSSEPRELERPAPPPAAARPLEGFSVFRRPATATDALPAGVFPGDVGVDSRLVLDQDGTRVWLATVAHPKVEGFGGRRDLCAVVRGKGGPGSDCIGLAGAAPSFVGTIRRHHAPDSVVFMLPDGARDPHVTLSNGLIVSPEIHDNAALVVPDEPPVGASFTAPSGVRQISRWRDLDAKGRTPQDAGCPRFDRLPADAEAQARRAALLTVDSIYPWIQEASVTGVSPVGPGLCTRAVTDRALMVELHLTPFAVSQRKSASLTQGRLLVGMLHGRMVVWMVQH